jgi:hypothetical protein
MNHLDACLKNANGLKTEKALYISASKINLNGDKTFFHVVKYSMLLRKKRQSISK